MQWKIKPLFVLCVLSFFSLKGRIVIPGDQTAPSFSFPIGAYAVAGVPGGAGFLVGAGNELGGDFSLSLLRYQASQFTPLAPEKITLNEKENIENPFRGKAIAPISFVSRSGGLGSGGFAPIFVTQGSDESDKKTIYLIEQILTGNKVSVISNTTPILDAASAESAGIVSLSTGLRGTFFAALLGNNQSLFGQGASSIALFVVVDAVTEQEEKKDNAQDSQKDNAQDSQKEIKKVIKGAAIKQISAALLDVKSDVLKIFNGSDIASIENNIAFHWDKRINRLFIGVQAAGGAAAADGVRSVVVARVAYGTGDKAGVVSGIEFAGIAPNNIFSDQNKIVGGTGVSTMASVYHLSTLHTSNTQSNISQLGLSYLIVNGDVGSSAQAKQRMVYALPLVCSGQEEVIGTIAKKNSTIINRASTGDYPVRYSHCFDEPAVAPEDLYRSDQPEDQSIISVGNGPAVGIVQDMHVAGDTVFISVAESLESDQAPGVFYSRAILDSNNAVIGWTDWRHVGNVFESAYGFINSFAGNVEYLTEDSGSKNNFKRTQWGNGAEDQTRDFFQALQSFDKASGIEGFINYPSTIPGISGTAGVVSLMITTGRNKVILGQSGSNSQTVFLPTSGVISEASYQNGTISSALPVGTNVITIEGGALEAIGDIITAGINVSASGRIFVGGVNGLAVLVDASGNGWDISTGIGNNFQAMPISTFNLIGDYSLIKKIISVGDYLYILTDQQLDRIKISTSNFAEGFLNKVTLANQESNIGVFFNDIIVSGKMALISTTQGLYRVGNGKDITIDSSDSNLNWTPVFLPFSFTTMTEMKVVSYNNRPEFYSDGRSGNVYVISGNPGNNQARVARYVVADTAVVAVDDNTIKLLDDVYQNDVRQYFLNAGKLIQQFYSDGALILIGSNKMYSTPAQVNTISGNNIVAALNASSIINITENTASGSQLVITDNSILTNE